jgi:hypothetical protein
MLKTLLGSKAIPVQIDPKDKVAAFDWHSFRARVYARRISVSACSQSSSAEPDYDSAKPGGMQTWDPAV